MKFFLSAGAIWAGLAVVLGAFGAHAFRASLEASGRFDTFETAVRYQMYHALALLAVGILLRQSPEITRWLNWAGWGFLAGSLIFSGSLYLICLTGARWWGAVAPIGGLLMIAGWVAFLLAVYRSR
ncbi:MAG: DUF423 domain-containing protein [Cytophagaceae bacterium]|nr:DUF423 domain-containing protein [Cytophagaceae bacterium]